MIRKTMLTACVMIIACVGFSQATEDVNSISPERVNNRFKPQNPTQDKTETLVVTGIKAATFTASNTADGSANSFKHSLQVIVPLTTNNRAADFQLVFYSENDNIPYSVSQSGAVTSFYFPMAVYETMMQQLQATSTARKTVQVKISQKTNGYREVSLVF